MQRREKEIQEEAMVLNSSIPIMEAAKKVKEEVSEVIAQAKCTEPERDVLKAALRAALALYEKALNEQNVAKRIPAAGLAHEALYSVRVVARLLS
jgi:hypothetical protein